MNIWNEQYECMSRDELGKLQLERLKAVVKRSYENIPFYKKKFDEIKLKPEHIKSLDDLKLIPFTIKNDLRDNYPFGLFAASHSEVVRIHSSSGTTGKPIVAGYTKNDIQTWAEVMARTMACAECTRDDIVQISYGYGLFTGGLGVHYGVEKIGAMVIPASGGNTKRQLMIMEDFGTTILACTPSYALLLAEAGEEMGMDFSRLKLKSGVFGAEPWSDGMRKDIENRLHLKAIDIYGLTEIIGPGVSSECWEQDGMHIFEDHFLAEIIDPETGEQLPYGEKGELVFTTITKEAFPVLRFRTRDITILNAEPCPCGRTLARMKKVSGRTDDMLIIRGVNVFPSQVESVLLEIDGVTPNYILVAEKRGVMDRLEVHVEVTDEVFSDEVKVLEELKEKIVKELESVLGISAHVKLVEPKSLIRSQGKAKRVIDKRDLDSFTTKRP